MSRRTEQPIHPLENVLIRPIDNKTPKQIYVVTYDAEGAAFITPYVSTGDLSFDTIKAVRQDLGMNVPSSQDDLSKELEDIIG